MKKAILIAVLCALVLLAFISGCEKDQIGEAFYIKSATVDQSGTVATVDQTGIVATVDQTGTVLK